MMDLLAQVLEVSRSAFFIGFCVFLRVGTAVSVMPAFGEQTLPTRVKLAVAFAFTLIVIPPVTEQLAPVVAGGFPYYAIVPEILTGLLMGVMLRLFILALQTAGTIAAQATSLAQLFGGSIGEPQPAIGYLLVMAGFAVAVHMGLHIQASELLIGSYRAFPFARFPDAGLVREWGVAGVSHTFRLAFSISAPFVIGGLIYNVALGAINRAMPQLMVAFVGAPALTMMGLILLAIALPSGMILWQNAFASFLYDPFSVAR